jgi:hypothetical protein
MVSLFEISTEEGRELEIRQRRQAAARTAIGTQDGAIKNRGVPDERRPDGAREIPL